MITIVTIITIHIRDADSIDYTSFIIVKGISFLVCFSLVSIDKLIEFN